MYVPFIAEVLNNKYFGSMSPPTEDKCANGYYIHSFTQSRNILNLLFVQK
jgi:hypothetical protein